TQQGCGGGDRRKSGEGDCNPDPFPPADAPHTAQIVDSVMRNPSYAAPTLHCARVARVLVTARGVLWNVPRPVRDRHRVIVFLHPSPLLAVHSPPTPTLLTTVGVHHPVPRAGRFSSLYRVLHSSLVRWGRRIARSGR